MNFVMYPRDDREDWGRDHYWNEKEGKWIRRDGGEAPTHAEFMREQDARYGKWSDWKAP